MKKTIYFLLIITTILNISCKSDNNTFKPNVSGAAFEVLWIIEDSIYKSPAGETLFNILQSPVEHLPQAEPQFQISRLQPALFDNLLKTTRNIVIVDVNDTKYTTPKIHLNRSIWANSQAVVTITAPDTKSLDTALQKAGHRIIDFIVKAERERMKSYYLSNLNKEALSLVYKQFGCNIAIPTSLNKYIDGENFLWITNGSSTIRQDFIIYSVPYTSKEQLTHEAILNRRDSVFKVNVTGGIEGSYVGTEYRYYPPETKEVNIGGAWAAETRGLWRMNNGEIMGGPFVSITRIDELNKKIITVEGFVFAPSYNKRNPLRQMDAMVYSLLLPQEINQVTVNVSTKTK